MINTKKRSISQLPPQPGDKTRPRKTLRTTEVQKLETEETFDVGSKEKPSSAGENEEDAWPSGENEEDAWPSKPPMENEKHPSYKTVPCKNFSATGYCSYGPTCQFMHGLADYKGGQGVQDGVKEKFKAIPCQRFALLGTCADGSNCEFSHGNPESKDNNSVIRVDNPKLYKTAPCRHFARTGFCSFGATCRFIHGREPASNQNYKTVPCQNWTNSGSCSYGDVCQFLHGPADPAAAPRVGRNAGPNGNWGSFRERPRQVLPRRSLARGGPRMIGSNGAMGRLGGHQYLPMSPMGSLPSQSLKPIPSTHVKTIPCSNWTQTGTCSFGEMCQYIHDERWAYQRPNNLSLVGPGGKYLAQSAPPGFGYNPILQTRNYKTILCRHFARSGSCPMGNMCGFRHDEDGSEIDRVKRGVNPNYKTAPCRNWIKTGSCPYEKVCQFKH